MKAPKVLNAGIIGFGMIGKAHAFGYATLPYYAPGLDVVGKVIGVATSRQETAERAQATIGCEFCTTDYREITENPKIDVVHICTPNAEHLPALLSAIQAGKHIYCEKPVVADADEAAQVRAALARRDASGELSYRGITQTAFHLRGFTAIRRAKELLDAGSLGQIIQYRAGYYHSSMLSPLGAFRWKHDAKGGSILDIASHVVDLIDYLVGLPCELLAQTTTLCGARPIHPLAPCQTYEEAEKREVVAEDAVTIMTRGLDARSSAKTIPAAREGVYEYPPNTRCATPGRTPLSVADPHDRAALTGTIEATKLAAGTEDDLKFELNGTRGSLRLSLMDSHYLEFFDATRPSGVNGGDSGWTRIACGGRYAAPESDFPSPKQTTGWMRAHVASLATFYRSISAGQALGPDLAQALRVQDALEAIKRSAIDRTWQKL